MKCKKVIYCVCVLMSCLLYGCKKDNPGSDPVREGPKRVFLLYLDGYNNLPVYMTANLEDLATNVPKKGTSNCRVLVYSHFASSYNYSTPVESHLYELSQDEFGRTVRDTLHTYPSTMISASAQAMCTVLNDVKRLFPDHEYGMVFSSHGTGWLPEEYYDNYDGQIIFSSSSERKGHRRDLFTLPETKSFGCQAYYDSSFDLRTHEIELQDIKDAFPFKLRYLIFDACLMGGIETAYQLKDYVDDIVFSQTEVLAKGFDYKTVLSRLLLYSGDSPDLVGFCKDSGKRLSEYTISCVDCSELDDMAAICKTLFEKYRDGIASVNSSKVQGFFRAGKHFFYDLRDMLVAAGISSTDLDKFDAQLEKCIACCYYSEEFLGITLKTDCGFSTYLPVEGNAELNSFYKELAWNKATSLVK